MQKISKENMRYGNRKWEMMHTKEKEGICTSNLLYFLINAYFCGFLRNTLLLYYIFYRHKDWWHKLLSLIQQTGNSVVNAANLDTSTSCAKMWEKL